MLALTKIVVEFLKTKMDTRKTTQRKMQNR